MKGVVLGWVCWAAFAGCSTQPATAVSRADGSPVVLSVRSASPPAPASLLGLPLTGAPRLVIENYSTAAIKLYGGYIVDEEGKLGTVDLWPHRSDCPDYQPNERLLPLSGVYDLGAPTQAFDTEHCAPGAALPAGRYVVHVGSGYGEELFASAEIELPLPAPVRLKMEVQETTACTPLRARRAARLALAAARVEGAPDALLSKCNPDAAVCATLPLGDEPPPTSCTLSLHERLLRARFAPDDGQPKELTAWLDHAIVFAQRPDVSRSTAAAIAIDGRRVVFEALTAHHWHEHGGDAARIGSMRVRVFNDTRRSLPVSVTAIDWQTDHSCGRPVATRRGPAVTGFEPKSLPPGTSELTINFDGREAYQAHCDVFASRATLSVEGRTTWVVSEHAVGRFEPLDRE